MWKRIYLLGGERAGKGINCPLGLKASESLISSPLVNRERENIDPVK